MRTTATYDPKHKQFVIHTPDFEAAKCWVGNLGKTLCESIYFDYVLFVNNYGFHRILQNNLLQALEDTSSRFFQCVLI